MLTNLLMKTGWKEETLICQPRGISDSNLFQAIATSAGCAVPANWQLVQACKAYQVV
jgi:hypothetical protein